METIRNVKKRVFSCQVKITKQIKGMLKPAQNVNKHHKKL